MNFVLLQLLKFIALLFCIILCAFAFKCYLSIRKQKLKFLYDIGIAFVMFSIVLFFKVNFT